MNENDTGDRKTTPMWRAPMLWLKRLYEWVLHWADTRYGTPALGGLAFAESSFFPIPPDPLLMALTLGRPARAWWYAFVCSVASVLGGVLGYYIGAGAWEATKDFFFTYLFTPEQFEYVTDLYRDNAFISIFTAAFTPIPFKVFTIAAGVSHEKVSVLTLILASSVGRPLRFFLVAGLLHFFGQPVKRFIDRYFDWLALLFVVLLIGGFLVIEKLV